MDKELLDAIETLMDKKLQPINDRLDKIEERTARTDILLENDIATKINLIFEGFSGLNEKVKNSSDNKSEINDTKDRVHTLETVVAKHSKSIQDLKKKIG